MGVYHCGVEGPVFLQDGRVVTSDTGAFELVVSDSQDQALVEGGLIIELDESAGVSADAQVAPSLPSKAAASTKQKGA